MNRRAQWVSRLAVVALGASMLAWLPGCGRPALSNPGPDVEGDITVWGPRVPVKPSRVADHRVWGPDFDVTRFDDGYRGKSVYFGLITLHPCDNGQTCGMVGNRPSTFKAERLPDGRVHAEGSWSARRFAFDLDEKMFNGAFGDDRYLLERTEAPVPFFKGKTGIGPFYDATIALPKGFFGLQPDEQAVYLVCTLMR